MLIANPRLGLLVVEQTNVGWHPPRVGLRSAQFNRRAGSAEFMNTAFPNSCTAGTARDRIRSILTSCFWLICAIVVGADHLTGLWQNENVRSAGVSWFWRCVQTNRRPIMMGRAC